MFFQSFMKVSQALWRKRMIKNFSFFKKIVLVEEEISLPCLKMQQKSGGKKYGNYLQLSRYDKLYASRQKLLMQLFFRHHFCETNFGY